MKIRKILLFPAFALIGSGLSGCSLFPTVTFYDEDGKTILEKDENVRLGSEISYDGKTPEKPADKAYVYTFKGWVTTDKVDPKPLEEGDKAWGFNIEYKAVYDKEVREYEIKWLNEDGSELTTTKEKYGTKADEIKKPSVNPVKKEDNQYTYKFSGWSPLLHDVEGDQEYKPEFQPSTRVYKVIFHDAEGKVISSCTQNIRYGETPTLPSAQPAKQSTDEFDYEFVGWQPALHPVLSPADTVYDPDYKEIRRSYTVQFLNWDGTVLKEDILEYGTMPVEPTTPERPEDSNGKYTFAKWDKEISTVKGNVVYTALYDTTHKYNVRFVDFDDTPIKEYVAYEGDTLLPPPNPQRADDYDNQLAYKFSGWDKDVTQPVSNDITLKAEYEAVRIYNIKFIDGDQIISDKWVEEGVIPDVPLDPFKEPDDQYVYEFKDWGQTVTAADANVEYVANYDFRPRLKFQIQYNLDDSSTSFWVYELDDITLPTILNGYDVVWYWTPSHTGNPVTNVIDIYGNLSFYGVKTQLHPFNVTFNAGAGEFEHIDEYPSTITCDLTVQLDGIDENYKPTLTGYHFIGWYDEDGHKITTLSNVLNDVVLTARYNANDYTISLYSDEQLIGSVPATYNSDSYFANLPQPQKPGYEFVGWEYNNKQLEGPYTYANNIDAVAKYSIKEFDLKYDFDGGTPGADQPSSYTVETFDEVLPEPTKVGYTFESWTVTIGNQSYTLEKGKALSDIFGEDWIQFFSLNQACEIDLAANYSGPHAHKVTYDYNGGSRVYTVTFMDGNHVLSELPVAKDVYKAGFWTASKDGKQFAGWSTEPNGEVLLDSYEIDSDIKLYALWNDVLSHPEYDPTVSGAQSTFKPAEIINVGGSSNHVQLYNSAPKFFQFVSYVDQDLIIKVDPEQGSTNACVLDYNGDKIIPSVDNEGEMHLSALAGHSYTIQVFGTTAGTSSASISIRTADPSKLPVPDFEISTEVVETSIDANFNFGEALTAPVQVAQSGYVFVGWFDANNKQYNDGDLLDVDADLELFAHWEQA